MNRYTQTQWPTVGLTITENGEYVLYADHIALMNDSARVFERHAAELRESQRQIGNERDKFANLLAACRRDRDTLEHKVDQRGVEMAAAATTLQNMQAANRALQVERDSFKGAASSFESKLDAAVERTRTLSKLSDSLTAGRNQYHEAMLEAERSNALLLAERDKLAQRLGEARKDRPPVALVEKRLEEQARHTRRAREQRDEQIRAKIELAKRVDSLEWLLKSNHASVIAPARTLEEKQNLNEQFGKMPTPVDLRTPSWNDAGLQPFAVAPKWEHSKGDSTPRPIPDAVQYRAVANRMAKERDEAREEVERLTSLLHHERDVEDTGYLVRSGKKVHARVESNGGRTVITLEVLK